MNELIIRLENVGKSIWDGKELREILKNVNLEVRRGEMIAITGESGSGKTTLLSIMGLLDIQTTGKVNVMSEKSKELSDTQKMPRNELTNFTGNVTGLIPQNNFLVPFLNVFDNIFLPLLMRGYSKEVAMSNTENSLLVCDIKENLFREYPYHLSGGEKQRVCVARALSASPDIILADEPTGNLDAENRDAVMHIFRLAIQCGKAVVAVTHDMEFARNFDRIYEISEGELKEKKKSVFG